MSLFDKIAEAMTNPGALQRAQVPTLISKARQSIDSDPDTAIKLLTAATAADPGNLEAWTALGDAYSGSDKPQDATEAYRKVIELDPGSPGAYIALGVELLTMEKYPDAENALMHGLLLEEQPDGSDFYNLALALYHQDKPGQAIAFCQKSLEKGSDADSEELLADCLYDLDCYSEAVEHYRGALSSNPANAHCASNLGFALELSDRPDEAIEALNSALENGANDAEVYGSLSRCYEKVGNEEQAQAMAEKYYDLNPSARQEVAPTEESAPG